MFVIYLTSFNSSVWHVVTPHYDNTPEQYTVILNGCKMVNKVQMKNRDIFISLFAQNLDHGYNSEPPEAVLTSTHDLYFRGNIRN